MEDELDPLEKTLEQYKEAKLTAFRHLQRKTIWPEFDAKERVVGRIRSRGINNENHVYMGPYGGFFYRSRVSGKHVSLKRGQRVEFN